MISRERVLRALSLEEPDRVPYCEHSICQEVAQKILKSKRQFSEKEISELLHRDNINYWAIPPIYSKKGVSEGGHEYIVDGLIKTKDDLKLMKLPDPHSKKFYQPAIEFINQKENFAANAIIFLGIYPLIESMGLETFSYTLYDDLELIDEILTRYTDWSTVVVEHLIEIGFDFIWAGDDMAFKSGTIFSPKVFREIILPKLRKVADKITVPWIQHSDGNLMPILDDLLTLGMNAIHPIEPGAMDIEQLKKDYGSKICLVGNITYENLILGTPEKVEKEVKEKIKKIAPGGGYIVSSANSISPDVKPENALAMAEAIQKYGKYPID